jgi:hypothetical protein
VVGVQDRRTASGSQTTSSRSAHDSALTTMSSPSAASRRQMSRVRTVSPVPPLDLRLSGTVETSAARRHHRSGEAAQRWTASSGRRPRRHAGPETEQPKASTDPQSTIPSPSRSTSSTLRWSSAPGWWESSL